MTREEQIIDNYITEDPRDTPIMCVGHCEECHALIYEDDDFIEISGDRMLCDNNDCISGFYLVEEEKENKTYCKYCDEDITGEKHISDGWSNAFCDLEHLKKYYQVNY